MVTMFLTLFIVTRVSILSSDTSNKPYSSSSQAYGMLRYRLYLFNINPHLRYITLAPLHFRRKKA